MTPRGELTTLLVGLVVAGLSLLGAPLAVSAEAQVEWHDPALGPEGPWLARLATLESGRCTIELAESRALWISLEDPVSVGKELAAEGKLLFRKPDGEPLDAVLRSGSGFRVRETDASAALVEVLGPLEVPCSSLSSRARPSLDRAETLPLGTGDVLEIEVFGVSGLDRKARVEPDGSIPYPILGRLSVAGLTVREVEEELARRLRSARLVEAPRVSVVASQRASRSVYLLGSVAKPGAHELRPSERLLETLGRAGGIRPRTAELVVVRPGSSTAATRTVDPEELLRGDPTQNVELEPGDLVLARAAENLRVWVEGAVANPGPIEYLETRGITVLEAIIAAGGTKRWARESDVRVVRRSSGETIRADLDRIRSGDDPDVDLEDDDLVVVKGWF